MTLQVPAIDIAPFLSGDANGKRQTVEAVRAACRSPALSCLPAAGRSLSLFAVRARASQPRTPP